MLVPYFAIVSLLLSPYLVKYRRSNCCFLFCVKKLKAAILPTSAQFLLISSFCYSSSKCSFLLLLLSIFCFHGIQSTILVRVVVFLLCVKKLKAAILPTSMQFLLISSFCCSSSKCSFLLLLSSIFCFHRI